MTKPASSTSRPGTAARRAGGAVLAHSPSGIPLKGQQGRLIGALGERIVRGAIRAGDLLPREPDLMEEFAVSRTSVREAIKVLSAKGLVETRQKVGTRVRAKELWNIFDTDVLAWQTAGGMGDDILKDLLEMRQVIEPAAARFAASRAGLDDIARIERACRAMGESTNDPAGYAHADVAFHMAVFGASKNMLMQGFAHFIASFLQASFQLQQESFDEEGDPVASDVANHVAIFEAINVGDAAAAEAAMLRVILHGKASLLRAREKHAKQTKTPR
jgi:DNA-binding FadR family transcriptional regulator